MTTPDAPLLVCDECGGEGTLKLHTEATGHTKFTPKPTPDAVSPWSEQGHIDAEAAQALYGDDDLFVGETGLSGFHAGQAEATIASLRRAGFRLTRLSQATPAPEIERLLRAVRALQAPVDALRRTGGETTDGATINRRILRLHDAFKEVEAALAVADAPVAEPTE